MAWGIRPDQQVSAELVTPTPTLPVEGEGELG